MITLALVCILATVAFGYYLKIKWKLSYWKRQGIEQTDHKIFDIGTQFTKTYKYLRKKGAKYGGSYLLFTPQFVAADLDLVKNILQTDFSSFVNHGLPYDEKKNPLGGHLFFLEDEKWRNMRIKLTPTFTSGKMKMMFQTLADTTHGLVDILKQNADSGDSFEIKDVLSRYTTDVIGSVAFGLECNSIKDPDSEFRQFGKSVFKKIGAKIIFSFLLPDFFRRFLVPAVAQEKDPSQFFMQVVRDTVKYRETNNVHRNDFLHLLLQLKNRGTVSTDNKIVNDDKKTGNYLTMNELAAQCFGFFIGGFETSSTTMTFALYELSMNLDVQEKLRKEIKGALAKNNGQMTYDVIMGMEYLDMVIKETLRLHPAVKFLIRKCNKDYKVPDSDYVIKSGFPLVIPVEGIQTDPEIYPDPEKFDPERFSAENSANRHPFAYIPFGEGPRMCIGFRFALLQTKVGLTSILSNFRLKMSKKMRLPLKLENSYSVNAVEGGMWLDIENIE